MAKKMLKPERSCADCIHEHACQAWNIGTIHFADASNCVNYETERDSLVYFIGYQEGMKNDGTTNTYQGNPGKMP